MDNRTSFEEGKTYEFKEIANIVLKAVSKVKNNMDRKITPNTDDSPLLMILSVDRVAFVTELINELFQGLDI